MQEGLRALEAGALRDLAKADKLTGGNNKRIGAAHRSMKQRHQDRWAAVPIPD
jgi:hypothetical protein